MTDDLIEPSNPDLWASPQTVQDYVDGLQDALTAAQARVAELEAHISEMLEEQECACGYDNPSDICLGHLPRYKRDVKAARLQGLGEALQEVGRERLSDNAGTSVVAAYNGAIDDAMRAIEALKAKGQEK